MALLNQEGFTEAISSRIDWLLHRKYEPCTAGRESYANCFGTMLWVLGLGYEQAPEMYADWGDARWEACDNAPYAQINDYENMVNLLNSVHYQKTTTHQFIQIVQEEKLREPCIPQPDGLCAYQIDPPVIQTSPAKATAGHLRPGDVLLFGNEDASTFTHAAVYVGEINGEPMMFEKKSLYCGPVSPYAIVPVQSRINDEARGVVQMTGDTAHYLHVFRRAAPQS